MNERKKLNQTNHLHLVEDFLLDRRFFSFDVYLFHRLHHHFHVFLLNHFDFHHFHLVVVVVLDRLDRNPNRQHLLQILPNDNHYLLLPKLSNHENKPMYLQKLFSHTSTKPP